MRITRLWTKIFVLLAVMVFAFPSDASARKKSEQVKTIKILAIGNSFSQDAIEQNLWEIAHADNINLIIGNLYYGGCSLEQHWQFLTNGLYNYQYRKVVDGVKTDTPKYSLPMALEDEEWDYISFQQASHFSGMPLTYEPYLEELMTYVRSKCKKKTKFIFHSTWAYSKDSKHQDFPKYGCSQEQMFNDIIKTTEDVMDNYPINILVPAGTAIQNARTSKLGDTLNRDGYHLQLVYGRYTAACTWYEALFHKPVIGNTYSPKGITEAQKHIAQEAAHAAVKKPYKVTVISD